MVILIQLFIKRKSYRFLLNIFLNDIKLIHDVNLEVSIRIRFRIKFKLK